MIKHKVSHHLDFLSAASHSPVTDTQLNEEMLAWEIAKWLHFQPVSRWQILSACSAFLSRGFKTSAVTSVTRDVGVTNVTQRDIKRVW